MASRFLRKFSVWEEQNRLPFTYPPQFRDFFAMIRRDYSGRRGIL